MHRRIPTGLSVAALLVAGAGALASGPAMAEETAPAGDEP